DDKAKANAAAKQKAQAGGVSAAVAAKKAAEENKQKEAAAAKKAKADALAAKQKAEEAAAAKKAAEQKRAADALAAKKAAEQKAATKAAAAAAVIAAPVVMNDDVEEDIGEEDAAVAEPEVLPVLALTASDKEFVGTWEQISSDKIITLTIEKNTNFTLEQVEDDGTLTITGTWKSEGTMFMLNIKKVQRNVHSRETDIHRIYKVERLSNHRLLLRDKQNRIAYDLKR
nr:hypothetical protein [Helicobacteraceae bacterium]